MPRGLETCAAAYLRLRKMPQLTHLPRSALRRAAAADASPRIAFVPSDAGPNDDTVFWDTAHRPWTARYAKEIAKCRFAVSVSMRCSEGISPNAEWNLCCACGASVYPWPEHSKGFIWRLRPSKETRKRHTMCVDSYYRRTQLASIDVQGSKLWYVADALSTPVVREMRICLECHDDCLLAKEDRLLPEDYGVLSTNKENWQTWRPIGASEPSVALKLHLADVRRAAAHLTKLIKKRKGKST